ncbi:hypothetical protein ABK040_005903 [Willaertia magna]
MLQRIVVDNGSGSIKAGFAGDDFPLKVIPSVTGKPKYPMICEGLCHKKSCFVGQEALQKKGILELDYPIRKGVIEDWDAMECIWNDLFYNELKIAPEENAILMTDTFLNPKSNREKMVEILFELFQSPYINITPQSILSLIAYGRTTGLVLDCGDTVTTAVPIYEGFLIKEGLNRIDIGGRDLTKYLMTILKKESFYSFFTNTDKEIINEMKHKVCFISEVEMKTDTLINNSCKNEIGYELPDGNILINNEIRTSCPECLFQPKLLGLELPGIHELIFDSIEKSDIDTKKEFCKNICLSGGSTLFQGITARLKNELNTLSSHLTMTEKRTIEIHSDSSREYYSWIGGSIFASTGTFMIMKPWLTKGQYADEGISIIDKIFF